MARRIALDEKVVTVGDHQDINAFLNGAYSCGAILQVTASGEITGTWDRTRILKKRPEFWGQKTSLYAGELVRTIYIYIYIYIYQHIYPHDEFLQQFYVNQYIHSYMSIIL